jgi:hypothetical protein
LAIQYKNLHIFEQTVKGFVYSVKLKLEFSILGKLVDIVQENKRALTIALGDMENCVDNATPSSPVLQRQGSPNSIPLAEKASLHHLEHPLDMITETPNGSISEHTHRNQSIESAQARRRGAKESDIAYAEVVRSITTTTK